MLIFKTMFFVACASSNYALREAMQQILVKVFLSRVFNTFGLAPFEVGRKHYYFIEASFLSLLNYDLVCLQWLEKLKIVNMYLFFLNQNLENFMRRAGGYVLKIDGHTTKSQGSYLPIEYQSWGVQTPMMFLDCLNYQRYIILWMF